VNEQKIVTPPGIGLAAVLRVGQLSWMVKLWLRPCATFWQTRPNAVVVWRLTGTATWRTLLNITSRSILARWLRCMKTWRHPQNRKYISFRYVA